jgi:plastocyanin
MRRSGVAALLGFVLIGALAPAAGAADVSIHDFAFSPKTVRAALATGVAWHNNGPSTHTATADVTGFFATGHIASGTTSNATMRAAGTFAYHCSIHASMHGTIKVPVSLSDGSVRAGQAVTVTFAVANAPAAWRYDVQRRMGAGAWATIRSNIAATHLRFTPTHSGSFAFRARAHNAAGAASGWSPAATLTAS